MNLKPCFKESSEHIVDQEREFKRMKSSSSVVYEHSGSSGTKNSADRFPFGINCVGPTTFSGENFRKCGEYDMSKSSTVRQVPENKLKKQGVMPSFLGKMDSKINQEKHLSHRQTKTIKMVMKTLYHFLSRLRFLSPMKSSCHEQIAVPFSVASQTIRFLL
ncbi:hypothetical protein ACB094_10G024500 [Castanea mollissima]